VRPKLLSIGDDFRIENDRGQRLYKADGNALRLRTTLIFEDADRRELAKIQKRVFRLRDSMEIEDTDAHRLARVTKKPISPMHARWAMKVEDGPVLHIWGNVLDHEYGYTDGPALVATVSKKWFRLADTYGVQIAAHRDPMIVLAATAALDATAHDATARGAMAHEDR
jgi:uncharacterized protein YxjI